MKKHLDPLGRMLLRRGVLDEDALGDVLEHQRRSMPLASLCWVLGHASEEDLVRTLAKQRGMPGVVLERCAVHLDVLTHVPAQLAISRQVLPLREDEARVFVAVDGPLEDKLAGELGFLTGKTVVPHLALQVVLARTIRAVYAARAAGESWWYGAALAHEPFADPTGTMAVVSDVDELPTDVRRATTGRMPSPIQPEVREEVEEDRAAMAALGSLEPEPSRVPARPEGPPRILIVDDDFATRHLLVKLFEPAGWICETAASGMEAVKRLKAALPDLVIADVMLPEINGFQICRSIKRSYKYAHIPVVLLSAVIDSGKVTDDLLRKYSADAYFEKPIATATLKRKVELLLQGARTVAAPRPAASPDDESFEQALTLYREGKLDQAIVLLRRGLEVDPLSTRHHFVLANVLQRKNELYEAIDEYEATVHLKPDYFPALSRLAYLYYKQGFAVKAVETWRKALPHCPDPAIRQNIEAFMRKLIAKMQSEV